MRRLFPAILVMVLLPMNAFAHAIGVTCTVRDGKVAVEAFYDDDTPAHKAKVQVVDAKNEVIATGITDKNGVWQFDAPVPGKYEVRIDAGAGHRAKKSLVIPGAAALAESPNDDETPIVTAPEPTREELTRTPWWRIGLGVGLVFAVSLAVMGLMQWRAASQKR